jgi:hypothetical protein
MVRAMINLQEVFDVSWDITCAYITTRQDSLFIHEFVFVDKPYRVTSRQWYAMKSGELTIVLGPINWHGQPVRGTSESGWGFKERSIPKELMEAPITVMSMRERCGGRGTQIRIDVECNEMTVEILKQTLAGKALKFEEDKEDANS